MQGRRFFIANNVVLGQVVKLLVYGLNLRIRKEYRSMKRSTFQTNLRRLNQCNGFDLLCIAVFTKEIRIAHCSQCLPTAIVNDIDFRLFKEFFWQFAKSVIQFGLVHFAESVQIGGHLWLGVQDVNASVQGLKEFILQGLRQFAVEFGGQIPHFVESRIVHVFQLVGIVGVLFYHHSSSSFTAVSSVPQYRAWLSAVPLAFRLWFCKLLRPSACCSRG